MKEYICEKCGHPFDSKWKLEKHLARKYPCDIGDFECNKCGKKFMHQSNLSAHRKICQGKVMTSSDKDKRISELEDQVKHLPSIVPPIEQVSEQGFQEIEIALLERISHLEKENNELQESVPFKKWQIAPLNIATATETIEPQIYFGLPGPKLQILERIPDHAILVKFGSTDDYVSQHQIHKADYGGFTQLDSVITNNPKHVGKNFKAWLQIKDRLVKAKSQNKETNDSKLILVRSQEDYEGIVHTAVEFADAYVKKVEEASAKDHIIRQIQQEKEVETLKLKLELMRMQHDAGSSE